LETTHKCNTCGDSHFHTPGIKINNPDMGDSVAEGVSSKTFNFIVYQEVFNYSRLIYFSKNK
jgi:hypothetical protein